MFDTTTSTQVSTPRTLNRRLFFVGAAVSAAGALSACSASGNPLGGESKKTMKSLATPDTSNYELVNWKQAGIDPNNPPKAIATQVYKLGEPSEAGVTEVTVELLRVQKRDQVTDVTFALSCDLKSGSEDVYNAFLDRAPNVRAFDLKNLKIHNVLTSDGVNNALESDAVYTKLFPKKRTLYWAVIATPQSDVVDIEFHEAMQRFTDVKVS